MTTIIKIQQTMIIEPRKNRPSNYNGNNLNTMENYWFNNSSAHFLLIISIFLKINNSISNYVLNNNNTTNNTRIFSTKQILNIQ